MSTERVGKQLLLAASAAIISGIIIFTIIEVLHVNSVVFGMAVVSLTFAGMILMLCAGGFYLMSGGNPGEEGLSDLAHKMFQHLRSRREHTATPPTPPDNQPPPRFAAYLLRFLPKEQRDALLGDLEEVYWEIYDQCGEQQAWKWYRNQTIRSLCPLFWRTVRTLLKSGVLGWFGDMIRRFIP